MECFVVMEKSEKNVGDIVSLTPAAVAESQRRLDVEVGEKEHSQETKEPKETKGLRLAVKGGGCSGLSYLIKIDVVQQGDYVSQSYGFPIFVDRKSSLYLKGVVLDYQGGFMGNGFKFINPNASTTCGCGESFSL